MKNKNEIKLNINWLIISCCAVFGLLTLTNFTTSRLDQKSVDYVQLFPEPSFDKSSFRPESAIKLSSTFERSFSSQMMGKIKPKPELGTLEQIKAEFPDMQLDASGAAALTETIDALAELTRGFNMSETRQWSMKNGTYNCSNETSTHLAFIIPFRDESITQFRTHQLNMMLHYTIRYLIKQQSSFTMIIVNQESGKIFNKAKLLNIGFGYASKYTPANCFVFHDVDLIAEGEEFVYYCNAERPLHFSAWRNNQNYSPSYAQIMGGVTSFTKQQLIDVNGYSNEYWGWGAEDDDMSRRVRTFYKLSKVPRPKNKEDYHIYQIQHERDTNNKKNKDRVAILSQWKERWKQDGINTLKDWGIADLQLNQFYLNLTVRV